MLPAIMPREADERQERIVHDRHGGTLDIVKSEAQGAQVKRNGGAIDFSLWRLTRSAGLVR